MSDAPRWVRHTGVLAVGLVAGVAAVVSYAHMHQLAVEAGEGWRSWLEPLSVDGLLVGASLVLLTRRSRRPMAWLAVAVGLVVSLLANLAAAGPGLVAHLVAAWPAVALALSYETLLSLLRPAGARAGEPGKQPEPVDEPEPAPGPAGQLAAAPGDLATAPGVPGVHLAHALESVPAELAVEPRDESPAGDDAELADRARQVVQEARQAGRQVGRTRLARALNISEPKARKLLEEVAA